jgi:hypothetical protein
MARYLDVSGRNWANKQNPYRPQHNIALAREYHTIKLQRRRDGKHQIVLSVGTRRRLLVDNCMVGINLVWLNERQETEDLRFTRR